KPFDPPVDVVIEAGHFLAAGGRVEVLDQMGGDAAGSLIGLYIGHGVLVAKSAMVLVAIDRAVEHAQGTQHLPEELHMALLWLLGQALGATLQQRLQAGALMYTEGG